jgi:hypothetical protein
VMAFKTEDLYEKAIKAIKENDIYFIDDLSTYLPCTRKTFYEHFPAESDNLHNIKELLGDNVIKTKQKLKKKWKKSDNPSMSISLYKLLGTNEERRKLSQSFQDHTSGGDKITGFIYANPDDKTDEETT